MSETILKRIKQLENQNEKFVKLLDATLRITSEDSEKCLQLECEANFLKKVVNDLENQKKQLEDELKLHLTPDPWISNSKEKTNIQNSLNDTLNDIERGSSEIQQLDTDNDYLKTLIQELEMEKETLLNDIKLVKKANKENDTLVQEHLKLKQELALLQSTCTSNMIASPSVSGQDLIKQLSNIDNMKRKLENDIKAAQQVSDPLGIPVENTVLELKISGLEKQKEDILKNLRALLLQSANEISALHNDTADSQLRGLLNELDIHKTILMMNLNEVKELHIEEKEKNEATPEVAVNDDKVKTEAKENHPAESIKKELPNSANEQINVKQYLAYEEDPVGQLEEFATPNRIESGILNTDLSQFSSFPSNSSEIIQQITEIREAGLNSENSVEFKCGDEVFSHCEQEIHDLPPVSEEEEIQNELLIEHEQLKQELCRLEREQTELLLQIEQANARSVELASDNLPVFNLELPNELHGTFMREESSEEVQKLPLDDATNQMYVNEEQLLEQRIRELEMDNERIRRNLVLLLDDVHSDKDDIEVLEEGERLIKDYKDSV